MPMGAPAASSVHTDKPTDEEYRDIPQSERDKMSASDFAGKGTSFPIRKPEDVMAAVHSIGRAGPDNYDAATLKRNIIRIAKRKGFPLPEAWKDESHSSFPQILKTFDLIGSIEVGHGADGKPSSWVQIARTIDNAVSSRYGQFSITRENLRQMLANFKSGQPQPPTRIPVDYDHLSMDPQKPGDGIAAGWFVDMELREDGTELWGLIEWTPKAAEAIKQKEYQGVSPSFARNFTDKQGKKRGTTLLAAAITNHPFLEGMAPLTLCADGDLALILSGDRAMADEQTDLGKTYKMKDAQGNPVEVPEDELENCAYVKSLMARLPKAGEKVVKMSDLSNDQAEIVSLRSKLGETTEGLANLRAELQAKAEEVRLDKCKAKFESLVRDGRAIAAEREFALELAKDNQTLFDKWAGTHTRKVLTLNREHGTGEVDETDVSDPSMALMALVAKEQKANPQLDFSKAWDIACRNNPEAYEDYRQSYRKNKSAGLNVDETDAA